MKAFQVIAIASVLMATGCSTVMNDRIQEVQFSAKEPSEFTVTNSAGDLVASGFTPKMLMLDSASGAFRCETLTVSVGHQKKTVDTSIQGWFWVGTIMSLTSMIVDLSTGSMCKLPEEVVL